MNKPSFLSYFNFVAFIFLLCSYFGVIEPKNWLDNISDSSGVKVITPIQEVKNTLESYKKDLENLQNNTSKYALKSELASVTNNLQLKLDTNILDIKNLIKENQQSIRGMQGQTNISREIKYWQNKYDNNSCNYSYQVNSNLCIELRSRISSLQQKLSY
ncbi:hypothetical protein L5B97_09545 [Avibacterium sp. 20-15]|uniref:hypothetical protein n=1 Tax=unclassified Avibacterium TaxID=2685287 RepID=UPI00202651E3|nr:MULTISPECIES: hypothetical protein [unclassified Avibacterium]MCW9733700.1 hypothetical protein [Avibacterium sp. 20-15]URL03550.1 hypothetical protein L4F93_08235 [Avibacterium sp. 20-132]